MNIKKIEKTFQAKREVAVAAVSGAVFVVGYGIAKVSDIHHTVAEKTNQAVLKKLGFV